MVKSEKELLSIILGCSIFKEKPPVLVDVGASGDIHAVWRELAPYSICIAFDPDNRELQVVEQTGKGFKKFYMINRIVSDTNGECDFYLTKSPYCSSSLLPNENKLQNYIFADLFTIENKISLNAVTINEILNKLDLDYIDWYKTDTQGTDLKIFSVISEDVRQRILVAEFEPGIMDAYIGENKLHHIMAYFDNQPFWCDDCVIKGVPRLSDEIISTYFQGMEQKLIKATHKKGGFWAEISYMNDMTQEGLSERQILLMMVFAIIKSQYGFIFELLAKYTHMLDVSLVETIKIYCIHAMKKDAIKQAMPLTMNKLTNKIKSYV